MSEQKWYFTAGLSVAMFSEVVDVWINVCDEEEITIDEHVSEILGDRIPEDWEEVRQLVGIFLYGPAAEGEPMDLQTAVKIWEAAGFECLRIEDEL